ncbi:hypothetical protein TNCV_5123471, partial [Trichonephila clavipes]
LDKLETESKVEILNSSSKGQRIKVIVTKIDTEDSSSNAESNSISKCFVQESCTEGTKREPISIVMQKVVNQDYDLVMKLKLIATPMVF